MLFKKTALVKTIKTKILPFLKCNRFINVPLYTSLTGILQTDKPKYLLDE